MLASSRRLGASGGRLRFLFAHNTSATSSASTVFRRSRFLCSSTNISARGEDCAAERGSVTNIDASTQEIFLQHRKKNTLGSALRSHLSENRDALTGSNVACIYRSAASIGQALDVNIVRDLLQILNRKDQMITFTIEDVKDICQGHRYFNDKQPEVRLLLQKVVPKRHSEISFDSQRLLGLSLFGLQNMTALHPETRNILKNFTFHLERCPEPLDGSTISGALWGSRSMNSKEKEVMNFIKVMTQKIVESDYDLSPRGIAQSLNSLQIKSDKRTEVLDLLSALNCKLESVSSRMNTSEVCHSLNGLQTMSSTSPIVRTTVDLLCNQFEVLDEKGAEFSSRDLAKALGGLSEMGCSIPSTNRLMQLIDKNMQKLTHPISPSDLVIAFSGLRNMRSMQAGVPSLMSTLSHNISCTLHSENVEYDFPPYFIPYLMKPLKKMRSEEISVRNFLSSVTDAMCTHGDKLRFDAKAYTMCLSGMQSMQSSETSVRRFLACLSTSFKLNSDKARELDWGQICLILRGMSRMDNSSTEVQQILKDISQNIRRMHEEGVNSNHYIIPISSAMLGMRHMTNVSARNKSQKKVLMIYQALFEKLKENSAIVMANFNQGLGKNVLVSVMGSLTVIPSSHEKLSDEVMLTIVEFIKRNKNATMSSLYSYELLTCLRGVSTRPHTCEAADLLLRTFLNALSAESVQNFEQDICSAMKTMGYPSDEVTELIDVLKNPSVIGNAELNAHYAKSVSLPGLLLSLQESIDDCTNGDSVNILWTSNLVKDVYSYGACDYDIGDVAALLTSTCEFSKLFFSKHKRDVLPLRQRLISLCSAVLNESAPIYTESFDDFFKVFSSTESVWMSSGNKHVDDALITPLLEILKGSSFTIDMVNASKILTFLKKTNSNHRCVEKLLAIVNEKTINIDISRDRRLESSDFITAVRGLRYLINSSADARDLFRKFVDFAEETGIELSLDEIALAMASVKNSPCHHDEVGRALSFFHSQLKNCTDFEEHISSQVLLLSNLRFMDSSNEHVCGIAHEMHKRLALQPPKLIPVNQELISDFAQFFDNKRCSDSPAIVCLRDFFIDLLDITDKKVLNMYSLKVVQHLVSLKRKMSGEDNQMKAIYTSMAKNIIAPENAHHQMTPHVLCIGIMGLDTLFDSDGSEGVVQFCEKISSVDFSFQQVMLALVALQYTPCIHEHGTNTNLLLSTLAENLKRLPPSKVKFSTLMSAFRSVAELVQVSETALVFYPMLKLFLSQEKCSIQRIAKVLDSLENTDVSKIEIHELLEYLLGQLKECSDEGGDDSQTLFRAISASLVKFDSNSDVVRQLTKEVTARVEGPCVDQ